MGKFKVSYDCHTAKKQSKLHAIGISVEKDRKEVHPRLFCHSCYNICTKDGRHYTPNLTKIQWVEHSEDNCKVCVLFGQDRRGKKKRKGLLTGRLSHSLLDLIETIKERSPPSLPS